ncbi:MAG TPA: hypothetical protein VK601_22775 [Kofleriaceae bacterium]|nr:hypothetical protein [Kofleriaceae bacterium]
MRTPRCLVWFALLAAAALACARPNDQPRLQDEALAAAAAYDARLVELARRADEVEHRRAVLPHDTLNSAAAEHSLSQARAAIAGLRGQLTEARSRLKAVRPGAAGEVRTLLEEMRHRLDDGLTAAIADLSAVESSVAIAEQQRRPGAPAPEPTANPTAHPTPEPASVPREPDTDRSGTPIR